MDTLHRIYETFRQHPAVSTDSRRIEAGCLFFALKGEQFDGNRYAAGALQTGASLAIIDDEAVMPSPTDSLYDRYILVSDVLETLQNLAALHRETLGIPILAITGSNGKTTTKELIWRVLSRKWRTSVTEGNLNNHIGVPLTLLAMNRETEFGIVEMGASHQGEIARLCEITRPDFGLITNIGLAHLEGFGGPEGVKKGKGELFDYLGAHGKQAFYLHDDKILREMADERPALKTLPYSANSLACTQAEEGLEVSWQGHPIRTHLTGDYNRNNVASAIAVGSHFGVPAPEITAAIESYLPDNNRSQRLSTPYNTLILDAYNANPSSMQAALENFLSEEISRRTQTPAEDSPLQKAVILGDMGELGDYSEDAHRKIVGLLREQGLQEVLLVGPEFTKASKEFDFQTFPNTSSLCSYLEEHPLRSRLILIKGSRTNRLEQVVDLL